MLCFLEIYARFDQKKRLNEFDQTSAATLNDIAKDTMKQSLHNFMSEI